MKKLIFTLFVVFGSMVAFTGCQDDSEEIFNHVDRVQTDKGGGQGSGS